ncbi:hypothetical protein E3Q22_02666 [Wallemia mellicola]|uniref:Uncharacterized protein n=2 Tax=Wallemia mellicola TaxID=1708541 RepID=A0A4T0PIX9_9BASI|nr:hypothetical protein E3Q24_02990 [Wallemia mellicola]TIB78316.1 hypothetical protein E3Q22_02666 [Wallemia mellicola]TIB88345.1 hypothetical protein E3Q21_00950 [Wallemia mellicola]TIB89560.1 hypothetical protein E3Q19_03020 [Wallemia mellicola]TIB91148.1 hypothetical protein E3Q20_00936 [Wallemia mellicola]
MKQATGGRCKICNEFFVELKHQHTPNSKRKERKPIMNWLSKRLGRRSSTNVPPSPSINYELDDTYKPSTKRRSTLNGIVSHNSFSTLKRPDSLSGADEDASLKPLNSTKSLTFTTNSSSQSVDTNNSDDIESKTFISKASTKPTTVLSLDAHDGVAHIAQAPSPSLSQQNMPSTSYNHYNHPPMYTRPQIHNNPRPLSPPNDDASIMTLASSNAGRLQQADNSIRKSSIHSSSKLDDDEFSTRALAPNSRRASYDSTTTQSLRSYNIGTSPLNPIRSPDLIYPGSNNTYKKSSTTVATTAASFITASERQSLDSVSPA